MTYVYNRPMYSRVDISRALKIVGWTVLAVCDALILFAIFGFCFYWF